VKAGAASTPIVGRQSWRDLVFLHWELPPEAVRPVVPPPFDLHLREGRAWVGIVAFEVRDLRPRFAPIGLSFLETNLRTYVTLGGEPAIWFLTLDAASRLAVTGARVAYGLPYRNARMRSSREGEALEYGHVRRDGAELAVRCRIGAPLGPAAPGTLDHFLVERYRFAVVRAGRVVATEVRHRPYPLHAAAVDAIEESLFAHAGLPPARGAPVAHFSPGADVELLKSRRWANALA
jgi:uncharacterized protein YqjF (DUF2071 family)